MRARSPGPARSGARSGALLAVATAASIVAAYVFLLLAGRILGSGDYGSLAALLGVLTIVLIPAGGLQLAVSREVSARAVSGEPGAAGRLGRGVLRAAAVATAPLLAVALALAWPLSQILNIQSVGIVLLAVLALSTALVFPVAMGVLQGLQRFSAVGALYVLPWFVRLAVLGIAAAAGYRLGGAVFATVVGAVAATLLALFLIREPLRGAAALPRASSLLHCSRTSTSSSLRHDSRGTRLERTARLRRSRAWASSSRARSWPCCFRGRLPDRPEGKRLTTSSGARCSRLGFSAACSRWSTQQQAPVS